MRALPRKSIGFSHIPPSCFAFCFSFFLCHRPVSGASRGLHLVPDSELTTMSYQEYNTSTKKSKLSTDMAKVSIIRRGGRKNRDGLGELLKDEKAGADIRQLQMGIQSDRG